MNIWELRDCNLTEAQIKELLDKETLATAEAILRLESQNIRLFEARQLWISNQMNGIPYPEEIVRVRYDTGDVVEFIFKKLLPDARLLMHKIRKDGGQFVGYTTFDFYNARHMTRTKKMYVRPKKGKK